MDKIESLLQDKRRLYTIVVVIGLLLMSLVAFFLYRSGLQRERRRDDSDFQTRIALISATDTAGNLAVVAGAANATATTVATPTPTSSPTPRPTPTQTTTPASIAEWSERFRTNATDGLNALIGIDFTAERAEALLRRLAQDHGMIFVLASYFELEADEWAALVVPRTLTGETLPILFWRDPADQNRVRSQSLRTRMIESDPIKGVEPNRQFQRGLSSGLLRMDDQGDFYLLLIEHPNIDSALSISVWGQPKAAADFDLLWWSQADSQWGIQGEGSSYELVEEADSLLPSIKIVAALMPDAPLRDELDAPSIFLEKPPFAQQKVRTVWMPDFASASAGTDRSASSGYQLSSSELLFTPLTAFSRFLKFLQEDDLIAAGGYTTRLDLLQQAFDLELTKPGAWMGFYLDEEDRPLFDGRVTESLRFFDNGDRSRTFNALFLREEGDLYRLASLQTPLSIYEDIDLVTPIGGSTPAAIDATPQSTPQPESRESEAVPEISASDGTVSDANPVDSDSSDTDNADLAETATTLGVITVRSLALTATASVEAASATAESTEAESAPTVVPTETPTLPNTATPTATETPTETATETPTGTPTATATPIGIPALLPDIPPTEPGLVEGSVAASLSNLRGGPSQEFVRVAQLDLGDPVEYFGISETGDWLLLRVNDPGNPNDGVIGWISITLVYWNSDISILPRYFSNGLPVIPFTATPTATPTETLDPSIPTVAPTPTPRSTAEIRQPDLLSAQGTALAAPPPPPEFDELSVFVDGETIPASGEGIIDITDSDGQRRRLDVQTATIEIWGGLFGLETDGWISAPAELLWGGTEITIQAKASGTDPALWVASRVRIVRPPMRPPVGQPERQSERSSLQERAELLSLPSLAEAAASGEVMGLLGDREEKGVYLLTSSGTLQQILLNEHNVIWAGDSELAGMLFLPPPSPTGLNSFTWARTDGTGLLITMQPFYNINGVAGDGFGGIWWIETPQVNLDQWELWHYEPSTASIRRRLRSSGDLLRRAENLGDLPVGDSVVPRLLSARFDVDRQTLSLIMDSVDRAQQRPYTGLFAVELDGVALDGNADVPTHDQLTVRSVRQLLAGDSYRGPIKVNADQTKLAYFIYDSTHPSLTSGFVTPANRLNLLTLSGVDAGSIQTIYETQTRSEFLAPQLTWRGNRRLVVARSRFVGEDSTALDLFGLVEIRLPGDSPDDNDLLIGDEPVWSTHLLPEGQRIVDFTACRDGQYALLIMQDEDGNLQVGRWGGEGRPRPLFGLPLDLERTLLCWRAPAPS